MTKDLTKLEYAELSTNLRNLNDILNKLTEVENGLIREETVNDIAHARKQIEEEFQRRGYSEEEIADIS